MNTTATAIAHTLDANHAPLALVLDMRDTLVDNGELGRRDKDAFVKASTVNLVKDMHSTARILSYEIEDTTYTVQETTHIRPGTQFMTLLDN